MMQLELFKHVPDLHDKRVMVSLSAGINSAGLLCYLASEYPAARKPANVFLFYVHLDEHSPDSEPFVNDLVAYSRQHFERVIYQKYYPGSVLDFFRREKMIPHPIISPCSDHLKIIPIRQFMARCQIDFDLVGYVRTEQNRQRRQRERDDTKLHLIGHLTDEDCFDLVRREVGWYPAIYDIRDNGRQVFKHNNCLPCKNMTGYMDGDTASGDFANVQTYYPDYFERSQQVSVELGQYWGRQEKEPFDGYCHFCEF